MSQCAQVLRYEIGMCELMGARTGGGGSAAAGAARRERMRSHAAARSAATGRASRGGYKPRNERVARASENALCTLVCAGGTAAASSRKDDEH